MHETTAYNIPLNANESQRIKRQICDKDSFTCRDGSCISSFDVCDGKADCRDKSDESHSVCLKYQFDKVVCARNTFRCAYGACVDGSSICNGVKDCADNSDELLRTCPGFKWLNDNLSIECRFNEFQCRSGQCISSFSVCDGVKDCIDGSDETVTDCNDPSFKCSQNSFRCAYGACIEKKKVCNGFPDCADESDEDSFLCNSTSQTTSTTEKISDLTTPKTISSKCDPPESLPGTTYMIRSSNVVEVICAKGYALSISDTSLIACIFNKWTPPNQKCIPKCRGLKTITANYICKYKGKIVDCSYVNPGTEMTAKCEYGYFNEKSPTTNSCLKNGSWSDPLLICFQECGKLFTPGRIKPQIAFGVSTDVSMFPWNVAIYHNQNGEWIQACGGSLISAYMVVTAAHCLRDKKEKTLEMSQIKLAVGKYYRDWNREETETQIRDVVEMFLHDQYNGLGTNYQFDIAVIELSVAVKFSAVIMPVCVPDTNTNPRNYDLGIVAGWGKDENGGNTVVLKAANLPYIERENCIQTKNITPEDIPVDKFCASLSNGTTVMQGDSGAGLVFKSGRKYFIQGIVSTNVKATVNQVSLFTNINYNENRWFVQNLQRKIAERRREV
ncbi:modular serine protease-like isoform X2 [Lycorma delicatula]